MARYRFRQGASKEKVSAPLSRMPTTEECELFVKEDIAERLPGGRYRIRPGITVEWNSDGSATVMIPYPEEQEH